MSLVRTIMDVAFACSKTLVAFRIVVSGASNDDGSRLTLVSLFRGGDLCRWLTYLFLSSCYKVVSENPKAIPVER